MLNQRASSRGLCRTVQVTLALVQHELDGDLQLDAHLRTVPGILAATLN